jgi:predicted DNA-binding transcriptional regulator AlpA
MATRRTIGDVGSLPFVLTSEETAEMLGVSVDHLWALAREGTAPVEPLKLGRSYRWPTARLLALLGLGPDASPSTEPGTQNEAPNSPAEASPTSLAAPDRQVRRRRE